MIRFSLIPICATIFLVGCATSSHIFSNPFCDELDGRTAATTPSVMAARAAAHQPNLVVSHGQPKTLCAKDGSVIHGPLYFEDPFEEKGGEDGRFAWTGEDYLWMVYWRGRFMVNLFAFPVSAALSPPWQAMVSDGYLSDRSLGAFHDAAPLN
jgi:hypothetical protein